MPCGRHRTASFSFFLPPVLSGNRCDADDDDDATSAAHNSFFLDRHSWVRSGCCFLPKNLAVKISHRSQVRLAFVRKLERVAVTRCALKIKINKNKNKIPKEGAGRARRASTRTTHDHASSTLPIHSQVSPLSDTHDTPHNSAEQGTMSAVTSTSLNATRLSAKTSVRNSRVQRISAAARPCRRVNASRGFVVKAEAETNGNGASTSVQHHHHRHRRLRETGGRMEQVAGVRVLHARLTPGGAVGGGVGGRSAIASSAIFDYFFFSHPIPSIHVSIAVSIFFSVPR